MNETLLELSRLLLMSDNTDQQSRRKMKLIVSHVHNLPTPPSVFHRINEAINDPDTSAFDVANIISDGLASVLGMFRRRGKPSAEYLSYIWRHSLAAAILARIILRRI